MAIIMADNLLIIIIMMVVVVMEEELDRINQALPNIPAIEKTQAIQDWMQESLAGRIISRVT